MSNQATIQANKKIAEAFRAGRAAASEQQPKYSFMVGNPFAENGGMPSRMASMQTIKWFAFSAGVCREIGEIGNAFTLIKNARFCLRRAVAIGVVA